MSSATLEPKTKPTGDVAGLCRYLSDKEFRQFAVHALPSNLQQSAVLTKAFQDGLIELGRQNYSRCVVKDSVTVKKEGNRIVYDDHCRAVVLKKYDLRLDNDWSWMTRLQNRKRIVDILDEDKNLGERIEAKKEPDVTPRLHVRLTDEGIAALAA